MSSSPRTRTRSWRYRREAPSRRRIDAEEAIESAGRETFSTSSAPSVPTAVARHRRGPIKAPSNPSDGMESGDLELTGSEDRSAQCQARSGSIPLTGPAADVAAESAQHPAAKPQQENDKRFLSPPPPSETLPGSGNSGSGGGTPSCRPSGQSHSIDSVYRAQTVEHSSGPDQSEHHQHQRQHEQQRAPTDPNSHMEGLPASQEDSFLNASHELPNTPGVLGTPAPPPDTVPAPSAPPTKAADHNDKRHRQAQPSTSASQGQPDPTPEQSAIKPAHTTARRSVFSFMTLSGQSQPSQGIVPPSADILGTPSDLRQSPSPRIGVINHSQRDIFDTSGHQGSWSQPDPPVSSHGRLSVPRPKHAAIDDHTQEGDGDTPPASPKAGRSSKASPSAKSARAQAHGLLTTAAAEKRWPSASEPDSFAAVANMWRPAPGDPDLSENPFAGSSTEVSPAKQKGVQHVGPTMSQANSEALPPSIPLALSQSQNPVIIADSQNTVQDSSLKLQAEAEEMQASDGHDASHHDLSNANDLAAHSPTQQFVFEDIQRPAHDSPSPSIAGTGPSASASRTSGVVSGPSQRLDLVLEETQRALAASSSAVVQSIDAAMDKTTNDLSSHASAQFAAPTTTHDVSSSSARCAALVKELNEIEADTSRSQGHASRAAGGDAHHAMDVDDVSDNPSESTLAVTPSPRHRAKVRGLVSGSGAIPQLRRTSATSTVQADAAQTPDQSSPQMSNESEVFQSASGNASPPDHNEKGTQQAQPVDDDTCAEPESAAAAAPHGPLASPVRTNAGNVSNQQSDTTTRDLKRQQSTLTSTNNRQPSTRSTRSIARVGNSSSDSEDDSLSTYTRSARRKSRRGSLRRRVPDSQETAENCAATSPPRNQAVSRPEGRKHTSQRDGPDYVSANQDSSTQQAPQAARPLVQENAALAGASHLSENRRLDAQQPLHSEKTSHSSPVRSLWDDLHRMEQSPPRPRRRHVGAALRRERAQPKRSADPDLKSQAEDDGDGSEEAHSGVSANKGDRHNSVAVEEWPTTNKDRTSIRWYRKRVTTVEEVVQCRVTVTKTVVIDGERRVVVEEDEQPEKSSRRTITEYTPMPDGWQPTDVIRIENGQSGPESVTSTDLRSSQSRSAPGAETTARDATPKEPASAANGNSATATSGGSRRRTVAEAMLSDEQWSGIDRGRSDDEVVVSAAKRRKRDQPSSQPLAADDQPTVRATQRNVKRGSKVMALYDGYFYPGVITSVAKSGYSVRFDDKLKAKALSLDDIIPTQQLQSGQKVFARRTGSPDFVPGMIVSNPKPDEYIISFDDGEEGRIHKALISIKLEDRPDGLGQLNSSWTGRTLRRTVTGTSHASPLTGASPGESRRLSLSANPSLFSGMHIVLTGKDGRSHNTDEPFDREQLEQIVRRGGGTLSDNLPLTERSLAGAVVVTRAPQRTPKYLRALLLGVPCVHHSWLLDSAGRRSVMPFQPYLLPALADGASDGGSGVAQRPGHPVFVFSGKRFVVLWTNKEFQTLWKDLISLARGVCLPPSTLDKGASSGSAPCDVILCESKETVKKNRTALPGNIPVVSSDWAVTCIARREIVDTAPFSFV